MLVRIARGDAQAVKECIDRYEGVVWKIARRLSRSAADAEDGVQEAFIDLWRSASRFDPARSSEQAFVSM
ncbi:MAG TPA: sigma factor, partial [Candidatus Eisenbacteria bacterium]